MLDHSRQELPSKGFDCEDSGYVEPQEDGSDVNVLVNQI